MAEGPIVDNIFKEQNQEHGTRKLLFRRLGKLLGRPVVSYFTSFNFPVMVEDADADMLEGLLQKMDLSRGFALLVSSPGGDGMAAERIAGVCRAHSGTGEYWAIVPGKAKSAATMICFGASRILMGPTAELGPVDPQIPVPDEGDLKWFSAYNVVASYRELFDNAIQETGRLEPYLQQLANYDAREIKELEAAMSLSEDISVGLLGSGMLKGVAPDEIRKRIDVFLSPEKTKAHGRPIYCKHARECDLAVHE